MKIIVFTAAIGNTDTVRAPEQRDARAEYVCFSDRPCVAPYTWVPIETDEKSHLAARRLKILADHPRLQGADILLWHDASYRLRGNLSWLLRAMKHADLVAMLHPRRTRIEEEAMAIARYGYLPLEDAQAHVQRYREEGFGDTVLTSTGLLGRRRTRIVDRFNRLWWEETLLWGGRDQGSVDYASWAVRARILHVPGTVRENTYAEWRVPIAQAVPA